MMVGRRYYSEADMMRMQRDAEARVREMQQRARQPAYLDDGTPMPSFVSPNRNWRANPNGRQTGPAAPAAPPAEPIPQPGPEPEHVRQDPPPQPSPPPGDENARQDEAKSATTVIDDIVGSLGLESDTLLIIGLLLILVNQKADTTLILALAYLLF